MILACSDGVWHYFSENELGEVLCSMQPKEATAWLMETARTRARGTGDNLSMIVIHFGAL